jgi:hypothetical protein
MGDFLKIASGAQFLGKMMRFRMGPRIWVLTLMMVNMASLYFIDTLEGQVVLAVFMMGGMFMFTMDATLGFVRLMGAGHFLWFLMLPWLYLRLPAIEDGSLLYGWIMAVLVMNSLSLVIDVWDVIRYAKGEREPLYT